MTGGQVEKPERFDDWIGWLGSDDDDDDDCMYSKNTLYLRLCECARSAMSSSSRLGWSPRGFSCI